MMTKYRIKMQCTDLTEQCESLLVLWRTSAGPRIFPIQIQAIKSILSEEADGGLDERLSVCLGGHHARESGHRECISVGCTQEKYITAEQKTKNTYCVEPKFHPPTAKSVFKLGLLLNELISRISKLGFKQTIISSSQVKKRSRLFQTVE